jgi:hypothetical protein
MLKYCVNPACCAEFELLHSGDFYALERRDANTEFFWLCPECASRYALQLDAMDRVWSRLRSDCASVCPPNPEANLRLVAHAVRHLQAIPGGERAVLECAVSTPSHSSLRMRSL